MSISDRIREVAKFKGINLKKLAVEISISYRTLQNYLDGRLPSCEFLLAINEHLGVSIDWLLTGKGQMFCDGIPLPPSHEHQNTLLQNHRHARLTAFVDYWMLEMTDDQKAWLEIQLTRCIPEYGEFIADKTTAGTSLQKEVGTL